MLPLNAETTDTTVFQWLSCDTDAQAAAAQATT